MQIFAEIQIFGIIAIIQKHVKAVADLKIVFLVAEPVTEDRAEVQRWLETEAEAWGDILQPGLEDGHRKLGYKILAGRKRT